MTNTLNRNALMVITPYKFSGMWVFDDPAVGLAREPFVAGIDTMIDRLVASIAKVGGRWPCVCHPGTVRGVPGARAQMVNGTGPEEAISLDVRARGGSARR
jgi:hypothetical protein